MGDQLWMGVRYVLLIGFSLLAAGGHVSKEQVPTMVDNAVQILGIAGDLATMLWGFYVKWRTVSVPQKFVETYDLPKVHSGTGTVARD